MVEKSGCIHEQPQKRQPQKLDQTRAAKATSFFEFWPTWLMYLPVVVLWLLLAVRYRSLTLPLIANPTMPMGGMVGGSKHALMTQAGDLGRAAILPWVCYTVTTESVESQSPHVMSLAKSAGIELPFVCKPDMGCRGAGVKLVRTAQQLIDILAVYPVGAALLCQKLADFEPEVGIFYVRHPDARQGDIVSLTEKTTPSVVGDGVKMLAELVAEDARAATLLPLYQARNHAAWQSVVAKGERKRLLFSASHCRGAVFEDKTPQISEALVQRIDALLQDIPGFYYGRLDVKYQNAHALAAGQGLQIVEINGASSESIQIWDKNAKLATAIKTLLWQYKTLFVIGNANRKRGYKPPGILALLRAWRHERELTRRYPITD